MKNKTYRRAAGSFKYDDFDVIFRLKKDYEVASIKIDFEKNEIILEPPKKAGGANDY